MLAGGDDVGGFLFKNQPLSGGIQVTEIILTKQQQLMNLERT